MTGRSLGCVLQTSFGIPGIPVVVVVAEPAESAESAESAHTSCLANNTPSAFYASLATSHHMTKSDPVEVSKQLFVST